MAQFWDYKALGVEDQGSTTANMTKQHMHTPFPMPEEPSTFPGIASSTPSTRMQTRTKDAD